MKIPAGLILRTQGIWETIYGRPISEDEAQEIVIGVAEYLRVLLELDEKERKALCKNPLLQ
jgi:hypothetical protein